MKRAAHLRRAAAPTQHMNRNRRRRRHYFLLEPLPTSPSFEAERLQDQELRCALLIIRVHTRGPRANHSVGSVGSVEIGTEGKVAAQIAASNRGG